MPRMQLDAWGNAVRLRAEQLQLAPLMALLTAVEIIPEQARQLISDLDPAGVLPLAEMNVGDVESIQGDWEFAASFRLGGGALVSTFCFCFVCFVCLFFSWP